jgi:hypothetical protein
MIPAGRVALIARAKSIAIPVASCVAARVRPDHLIGDLSRDELAALVLVLADAADPVALRAVTQATEDGPDITDEDIRLRKAHAHAQALRDAGKAVPARVRALDRQYRVRTDARRMAA